MSLSTYYGGKKLVLAASHAKKVDKRYNQQLYNVLEEMSIASGTPMPELYVINDSAPNAFATGRDPQHAAVAVTTGLLDKLDRDELTGVIAHEMSHIKNFDIRYMMLMGVLVGLVALLSDFMLRSFFWGGGRRRSRNGGGGAWLLLILALVLAILAPIISKLIQLAVSRKREYLADASAAQFTRYPEGLASALLKISGDREVLEVANRATQHLYIVNPIKSFEARAKTLFSTHPPIAERVRRLRTM
jgi:heat shock protein HtpX